MAERGWVRVVAAVALCGVLAGCGDDPANPEADRRPGEPTATATAAPPSEPTATPTESEPTTAGVTTQEFCGLVRDIASGDAAEQATLELLRRGLPADLDGDAKQGLQVLLDHAPDLGSFGDSWRVYRTMSGAERADLRALTWWVTKSCGAGYLRDLVPEMPSLPDVLPDWR